MHETSLRIKCYCPVQHVLKHCDSKSGRQCKMCIGSTYIDAPNGLMACLSCAVCDEGDVLHIPVAYKKNKLL